MKKPRKDYLIDDILKAVGKGSRCGGKTLKRKERKVHAWRQDCEEDR